MELNFFTILILIMLAVWVIQAVSLALSQKGFTWKTVLNFLASACLIIGAVVFFGSALSATAGLGLSESFEWPIGNADAALKYSHGSIVVPHEPFASWFVAALGILLLFITGEARGKKPNT